MDLASSGSLLPTQGVPPGQCQEAKVIAFQQVEDEERDHLQLKQSDERATALCLSGGGIRSATFCLGVLQGLAKQGRLKDFDYLSTVSGGGYIGSWFSRRLEELNQLNRRKKIGGPSAIDQLQAELAATPEPRAVSNLRAYSNYLSPVWGLSTDFFTGVAIWQRNLVLNWLVLLPLLVAVVLLPHAYHGLAVVVAEQLTGIAPAVIAVVGGIFVFVAIATGVIPQKNQASDTETGGPGRLALRVRKWAWLLPVLAAVLADLALKAKASASGWPLGSTAGSVLHAPLALAALLLIGTLVTAIFSNLSDEAGREQQARYASYWIRIALGWTILFAIVAYSPGLLEGLFDSTALGIPAVGAGVWGVLIGIGGYLSRNHQYLTQRARTIRETLGRFALDLAALAFILALLTALSWAADKVFGTFRPDNPAVTVAGLESEINRYSDRLRVAETESKSPLNADARRMALDNAKEVAEQLATKVERLMANPAERRNLANPLGALIDRASALEAGQSGGSGKSANGPITGVPAESVDAGASSLKRTLSGLLNVPDPDTTGTAAKCVCLTSEWWCSPAVGLVLALALSGFGSLFVGVNTFSLHSFYGNRLARAYLGSARERENRSPDTSTGFDDKDNVGMHELRGQRPLHVVNLTLNLVKAAGERLEWQQRKAASFTVSPLHAGSELVDYRDSKHYASPNGISLARAMTISGAAAAPNMGYHSSPLVSFVMTFFNVRLGWWLPNPRAETEKMRQKREPRSALEPLIIEATGQTTEKRDWIYLSDGGHFDNLGLYEMVKRRCRHIVVVDASADPQREHGDLLETLRRIRVDLGVAIDFGQSDWNEPRRCRLADIHYPTPNGTEALIGKLVYLKPTLCGDEPPDVLAYAKANAQRKPKNPFPHQSTADQFFDEQQFESYRALGEYTVDRCLRDGEWISEPCPSWKPDSGDASTGAPAAGTAAASGGAGLGQTTRHLASPAGGIGPAAMIGAALAVGGTLGVTGTVALRDNVVRLDERAAIRIEQRSLDALKETPVKLMPPESIPVEVTVIPEQAGSGTVAVAFDDETKTALQTLLARLSDAIAAGTDTQDLRDKVSQLTALMNGRLVLSDEAAAELRGELQHLSSLVEGKNLKEINESIGRLNEAISGLPRPAVGAARP